MKATLKSPTSYANTRERNKEDSRFMRNPKFLLIAVLAGVTLFGATCGDIHQAVKTGDLMTVESLLEKDPGLISARNEFGYTPIDLASSLGNREMAELLIAKGADIQCDPQKGFSPLHNAADEGHKEIVELLLAKGVDPNGRQSFSKYWDHGGMKPLLPRTPWLLPSRKRNP